MRITPRTILLVALFNLSIGIGLVAGWLLSPVDAFLYERPVYSALAENYLQIQSKGFNAENELEFTPYNYSPSPQIPLVALDRDSAAGAFAAVPPEPMDWAVLLYQLQAQKVRNIIVAAPFTWDDKPIELVSDVLINGLDQFSSAIIGRTLTLSARGTALPENWQKIALKENQYTGNTSSIPPANKIFGEREIPLGNTNTAPSQIENDELFQPSDLETLSSPLFVRWNDSILPSAYLLGVIHALDLKLDDLYVSFGQNLRIGNKINIPIDKTGRVALNPTANYVLLFPADIITPSENPALSKKRKNVTELLEKSPVTCVWEPSANTDIVSPQAILDAKTISSLLTRIVPQKSILLHPLPSAPFWILLVDAVFIAVWALRFRTITRAGLFLACFGLTVGAAVFFFNKYDMWIPVTTLISALLCVCIASFFIKPPSSPHYRSEEEENEEPPEEEEDDEKTKLSVEILEFHEPNEVPIPHKKKEAEPNYQ